MYDNIPHCVVRLLDDIMSARLPRNWNRPPDEERMAAFQIAWGAGLIANGSETQVTAKGGAVLAYHKLRKAGPAPAPEPEWMAEVDRALTPDQRQLFRAVWVVSDSGYDLPAGGAAERIEQDAIMKLSRRANKRLADRTSCPLRLVRGGNRLWLKVPENGAS